MSSDKKFSVLFLYEDLASSIVVAQGLKDKGIEVKVVSTASNLIKAIVSSDYDIVGLSVSHTSCRSLSKIIKEKTKVPLMVYGEDKSEKTLKKIQSSHADYKVNGMLTSYNAWMKIHGLFKEKMKEDFSGSSKSSNGSGPKISGSIMVKGDSKKKDSKIFQEENKKKQTSFSFKKDKKDKKNNPIFSNRKESNDESITQEGAGSGQEINQTQSATVSKLGQRGRLQRKKKRGGSSRLLKKSKGRPSLQANRRAEKKDDSPSAQKEQGMQDENNTGISAIEKNSAVGCNQDTKNKNKKKSSSSNGLMGRSSKSSEAGAIQTEPKESTSKEKGLKAIDKPAGIETGEVQATANKSETTGSALPAKNSSSQVGDVQTAETANSTQGPSVGNKDNIVDLGGVRATKSKTSNGSNIYANEPVSEDFKRAVEKATTDIYTSENKGKIDFGNVNKISVIPVENNKEMGYLIFCSQSQGVVTDDDINNFKSVLEKEENIDFKGDITLGKTLSIDIFDTDIHAWAKSCSEFHFLMNQEQDNILVCFVKKGQIYPNLKKEEEPDLYKINIDEVPPLLPVNFEAFLYLKKNQKLIPYLAKGGSLSSGQVDRLSGHGFNSLFIKEEDIEAYYNFYVSQSINQDLSTEEFDDTIKEKAA